MRLDQYTADAICHSMGIGPFIDPAWNSKVLAIRLLLKPSFDPEVCITVVRSDGIDRLTVVALTEMLWRRDCPCQLPTEQETGTIDRNTFTKLCAAHHDAVSQAKGDRIVCVDGLGMNCAWATRSVTNQLESHVVGESLRSFVLTMVDAARNVCCHAGARNALRRCSRYIGCEYPIEPEPAKPPLLRIGVLGCADDVGDLLRLIDENEHGT